MKSFLKYTYTLALIAILAELPAYADESGDFEQRVAKVWAKGNKTISLGYTTGSFDMGANLQGKLDSRWGLTFNSTRNYYLHRKPIAGLLKFGLEWGTNINYMNFEKGSGSLKDIANSMDGDEAPSLGTHYMAAGIALGPTITVAPFIHASSLNLARLKFRAFFHVVPSYAAFITSNEDETNFHSAFCCFFAGGLNVQWRKLNIGFEYKYGRAKYSDMMSDLVSDEVPDKIFYNGGKPKFNAEMLTFSIGLAL